MPPATVSMPDAQAEKNPQVVAKEEHKAEKELRRAIARGYTFFDPKQRDSAYDTGDVYDTVEKLAKIRQEWELTDGVKRPYLDHVSLLANTWPQLRLLADFMEIGTSPARWKDLRKKPLDVREQERAQRASRTNIMRLDYLASGKVEPLPLTTSGELKEALDAEATETHEDKVELRLFVVEDLSRDVIESLGSHYDIEPDFFREQILDYAWYNTRDQWANPPGLSLAARRQHWLQLRFISARYFQTTESFKRGRMAAEEFNVLRRPDDDQNNKAWWDQDGAIVALTRTRASIWIKPDRSEGKGAVGVLLLDPTIKEGHNLWHGYRNWEQTTPLGKDNGIPPPPPRDSFFNDFVYWAKKPESLRWIPGNSNRSSNQHIPVQVLLHLICSEWLIMADYIKTRLGQIDWEIAFPEHFLHAGANIDIPLKKLHIWRRLVPLYREMLNETLEGVFDFPCHTTNLAHGVNAIPAPIAGDAAGGAPVAKEDPKHEGPIKVYHQDFKRALGYMEEYQQRIDRLTSIVTAAISIDDSRRGLEENRNVARLTWLATFYIPLSFVAGLFSMTEDLTQLGDTMKWYFAAALPLAVVSLGLAWTLTMPKVQKFGKMLKEKVTPEKKNQ